MHVEVPSPGFALLREVSRVHRQSTKTRVVTKTDTGLTTSRPSVTGGRRGDSPPYRTRDLPRLSSAHTELVTRRSEARFRALVQNGAELVTILAKDGTLQYCSPSVKTLLDRA